MPRTRLIFYREANGNVPVRTFIRTLQRGEQAACWEAILALQATGSQISGKLGKNLGSGIWELRVREGNVHIRLLYAFVGQDLVLLTHGITKEGRVPPAEIARAQMYLAAYKADPDNHSR